MIASLVSRGVRAGFVAAAALTFASVASAVRVGSAGPPASASARAAPQQPAHVQGDESASLRQGTISDVEDGGRRVRMHGIWLKLVPETTRLIRDGQAAAFDTLKAGEAVRFTVVPAKGEAPTLRVIYVP